MERIAETLRGQSLTPCLRAGLPCKYNTVLPYPVTGA